MTKNMLVLLYVHVTSTGYTYHSKSRSICEYCSCWFLGIRIVGRQADWYVPRTPDLCLPHYLTLPHLRYLGICRYLPSSSVITERHSHTYCACLTSTVLSRHHTCENLQHGLTGRKDHDIAPFNSRAADRSRMRRYSAPWSGQAPLRASHGQQQRPVDHHPHQKSLAE